jgi:hypothetical protein
MDVAGEHQLGGAYDWHCHFLYLRLHCKSNALNGHAFQILIG